MTATTPRHRAREDGGVIDLTDQLEADVARITTALGHANRSRPHRIPTPLTLTLLGGFELRSLGRVVEVPLAAQRLIAFLALQDLAVQRCFVAGTLWPEKCEERASANLRSTLWRIRQAGLEVVEVTGGRLRLSPEVTVDIRRVAENTRLLVKNADEASEEELEARYATGDLLPDWYDDWTFLERERVRILNLHALEAACVELARRGRTVEAVETGLRAVRAEPLRESANRALISAHLAAGNRSEAFRQFERYRKMLWDELAVEPSPHLEQLFTELSHNDGRSSYEEDT